jgi:transposase-like protein
LESGRVNPTWGTVRRIARAHGVDVATIEARTQATDRKWTSPASADTFG